MNWYVTTTNTHSNMGKIVLAGPFTLQSQANKVIASKGHLWGCCKVETICENIAMRLKGF